MSKNRKRGEGSISYEKSRKKWRVAFFDNEDNRHYKRFDTEQSAAAFLIEQINDINNDNFVAPSDVLFGRWVLDWLKTYKKDSVRQSTYDYYKFLIGYLKPLTALKLQEVTPLQIQQLYKDLLERVSANTTHKAHSLLIGIFSKAYSLGLIKKNIMDSVEAPHFEKKDIEIFTKDEIAKILRTCANHAILNKRYAAVLLAVTTGMRKGEVLGLRRCDVFLNVRQIFIRKILVRTSAGLLIGNPKTKASVRKLTVHEETIKELQKLLSNLPAGDEQLCFVTASNNPVQPTAFDKFWHSVLRNAGVEYKKFHTLRHTYATNLLAAGEPIIEVSRRLGHSKISHTLELYGHAMPDYDKILVDNTKNLYDLPRL
ncbi:tyrosine-type recombinase/integrase [Pectinatus haikarae]|uniref:Integrase n=1 Tax=Pectinatus haikarae TaxID=349096 RepID=A0ABT9Y8E5_9FIRM|nr:site-specific integrase [Pectinatus haikarae]MDQ0204109.1 integrase [Pectinatus haikarae]